MDEATMYKALVTACMVEVNYRHREFAGTESLKQHIHDVARWLTEDHTTFGLYLCGNKGNGKTTLVKAIKSLYEYSHSDEMYKAGGPDEAFRIVSAKDLVHYAKAYASGKGSGDYTTYISLRGSGILCIDDMGAEPRDAMQYGEYINAVMDVVYYRYEHQMCTMATSNLSASEISGYYDERFADRLKEMMQIINFGNDPSFR